MKKKITLLAGLVLLGLLCLIRCQNPVANAAVPQNPDAASQTLLAFADTVQPAAVTPETETGIAAAEVWICKSSGATRYHYNEGCGGLKRCTHIVEKTSVKEAEAVGLTACGYKSCR